MLLEGNTTLAHFTAVKEVTCVKLYTGKVRHNLKLSAALFICNLCNKTKLACFTIYTEVVIITTAHDKLFIVGTDFLADLLRCSKVKCSTLNASDFTCGDTVSICRCEVVTVEH